MLSEILEGCLNEIEASHHPSTDCIEARAVLVEAIEGLEALDHGEVQDLFVPTPTSRKGIRPFTAERCRHEAIGYFNVMRFRRMKAMDALKIIAEAYFGDPRKNVSAVRRWQSVIKKQSKNPEIWQDSLARILPEAYATMKAMGREPSSDHLLKRIKQAGKKYKTAMRKKQTAAGAK